MIYGAGNVNGKYGTVFCEDSPGSPTHVNLSQTVNVYVSVCADESLLM